ncbi:MAG TPA: zinc-binding alcohol dehydrogenase family protein [Solirubrobacteraceae bacterium]|jgi:NADPH2:quinone reductase|nr:zinc-binding alcohol dehydrogenase family protein [Solirubrobacteraceae bacterium]
MATVTAAAARLHVHGEPLVVEQVELEPGADEVLVELEYGGVNPIDRYLALGRVAPDSPLPRTLGGEGAGRIDGRAVLICGEGLGSMRDGVWSSVASVPRGAVIELPDGVHTREAAAMGVAGLTAWNCVHEVAGVQPGDRVLVLGAAGGVGSMIVSLVASSGATVWGQTGSPSKTGLIERVGAARAIVADATQLGAQLAELQPTVVFDPLGGEFIRPVVEAAAVRARIVSFGTSAGAEVAFNLQTLYRKSASISGYGGMQLGRAERRTGLEQALRALADGLLRVEIDEALPLAQVNEAFARIERRQVSGNLLLDLRQ